MSRRDQITMTEEEQRALLDDERVVILTSHGPRGWPHAMPMWFTVMDGDVWCWTFGKSQKVKNLERDNRCTLLVETGHEYNELKGIQIEAETEIVRDKDEILEGAAEIAKKYAGGLPELPGDAVDALRKQAEKRVGLRFKAVRTATWDHTKLGGKY